MKFIGNVDYKRVKEIAYLIYRLNSENGNPPIYPMVAHQLGLERLLWEYAAGYIEFDEITENPDLKAVLFPLRQEYLSLEMAKKDEIGLTVGKETEDRIVKWIIYRSYIAQNPHMKDKLTSTEGRITSEKDEELISGLDTEETRLICTKWMQFLLEYKQAGEGECELRDRTIYTLTNIIGEDCPIANEIDVVRVSEQIKGERQVK
jgi:hypothetical protein